MNEDDKKPDIVPAMITGKCPNCRKGHVFINKSVFPLGQMLNMKDHCDVCTNKLQLESNNGQGMNFVFTFILYFINLAWYYPIFGINMEDNSIFTYLGICTVIIILLMPWTMRLSRLMFMYFFIPYNSNRHLKKDTITNNK